MERRLKRIFFGLVLLHVLGIGYYAWHAHHDVIRVRDIPVDRQIFKIDEGSSLIEVLNRLHAQGLAPAPFYIRVALAWEKREIVIKKGTYHLPERASAIELVELFGEGRVRLFKVTIPEGLDRWQMAELLGKTRWGEAEEFRLLINDPGPIRDLDPEAGDLEGYLFPETYLFPEEASPKEVIAAMVEQFRRRTQNLRTALGEWGLSVREWVSFASLIEKESHVVEERPTIAGVFHNRLKRGMLLQCDPTIIYSLKLKDKYRGKIYRSDIRHDHPYNTYVARGLPPGPIASPSLSSLTAVLEPEEVPYLYFVAKGDGSHYFSKSLREHNRAVRKARRNEL